MNLNKIEEIFKSFSIAFDPTVEQSELASDRIQICDDCEFRVLTPIGPLVTMARCSVCGCVLRGKMFSPRTYLDGVLEHGNSDFGSCPKSKWMEVEKAWLINKGDTRVTE